jgi:hypothetical protein
MITTFVPVPEEAKMTLRRVIKSITPVGLFAALPSTAFAAANLQSDDFVGISFWLISMA